MRRIIAQARKELIQTSRDRLTLVLALVLPLVLMALLGKATSLSVTDLPVAVQDLDQTPLSRRYVDALGASLTFRLVPLPPDRPPEKLLDSGAARAAVIIPGHFERELQRGRNMEIQWLIDATDANTANVLRGNATALTQSFIAELRGPGAAPAIKPQLRFWYNPGRKSEQYFGPGILAVGLALFPPLLAALAMSREGEQQTILQVYVSSISAGEYLLGKILAYTVIALAEWALCVLLAIPLFGLGLAGDPTPFLLTTFVYLFCNVCFGAMIGAAIPNQAAAIQATQIGGFLLSFLLSGYIFPVSNIPAGLRWISVIVPARYYLEVTRDVFVRGGGWPAVWHAPLALALIGTFFFFRAWVSLRAMQVKA